MYKVSASKYDTKDVTTKEEAIEAVAYFVHEGYTYVEIADKEENKELW